MGIKTQENPTLEREVRFFEREREEIRKRFPKGFVAIYEERVVDSGPNGFDLGCKVNEKYGTEKVYVVNVKD